MEAPTMKKGSRTDIGRNIDMTRHQIAATGKTCLRFTRLHVINQSLSMRSVWSRHGAGSVIDTIDLTWSVYRSQQAGFNLRTRYGKIVMNR